MNILFYHFEIQGIGITSQIFIHLQVVLKRFSRLGKGIPQARQHRVVSALHSTMTWILGGPEVLQLKQETVPCQLIN